MLLCQANMMLAKEYYFFLPDLCQSPKIKLGSCGEKAPKTYM